MGYAPRPGKQAHRRLGSASALRSRLDAPDLLHGPYRGCETFPTSCWDDHEKVRWIRRPERADTVTEFRVLIGEPHTPLVDVGPADYLLDAGIVDGFVLANGGLVLITIYVTHLDATGQVLLASLRDELMTRARDDDFDLDPELGPRIADHNLQSDGRHALWDVAATTSAPGT